MTLNQVEDRLKSLAIRHKQIKSVGFGEVSEFLDKRDLSYPVCFFQDGSNSIDSNNRINTFNYKIYLLDLVHNSTDTKSNEREVISDMTQVANDLVALIDDPYYPNWKIGPVQLTNIKDSIGGDTIAGVAADISISALTVKDKCAVPKDGPRVFDKVFSKEMP